MGRDIMMHFNEHVASENYLSMDEVRQRCPVAFATEPTNKVSDKYVLASTATVIEDMEKLGWKVIDAKQRRARKKDDKRYSFHMIAFQNPEVSIVKTNENGTEEVECWPRIILTNSHDGCNSFKFMVGLFRLVCSNGLVIASERFADVRIRHINYSFEELREVVNMAIQELPKQIGILNTMKTTTLTEDQKKSLAQDLLKIKRHDEQFEASDETITEMLEPTREEDKGDDLFSVFNVLQEKLVKGGFKITKKGEEKGRVSRKVKSFAADLYLNKAIFEKAVDYLPAMAA